MITYLTSIWELDRQWLLAVNGSWGCGWDVFWLTVSQGWCWIPLYVAAIWVIWHKFGWRKMLVAIAVVAIALALADQTANFFKGHFPKLRPCHDPRINDMVDSVWNIYKPGGGYYKGGWHGTVSGHAATSMAIALTSAGIARNRWITIFSVLYVVLTCYSRMYLGVHFPLDITFGLVAGTIIGLLMLWVWKLIDKMWGDKLQPRPKVETPRSV